MIAPILLACPGLAFGELPGMTEILKPRDFPGWQSQNVCYPFVLPDGGGYRMYYSGSASEQWNESNWDQWVSGYVTSADTVKWKFPENYEQVLFARRMMEGDLLDPVQTAAVFDSIYAIAPCIIKTGSSYQLWYTGWNGETVHKGGGITEQINFRIGYATSIDGIRWTKRPGAVIELGSDTDPDSKGAACPYVLQEADQYRMWYEGYDGTRRRILQATSPDGITWTKTGVAVDVGGSGAADELEAANPMVIDRNNRLELWYRGRSTSAPNYHILRARLDGTKWEKLGEVALQLDPELTGSERIDVDSAIVKSDGKVQVFFARERILARSAAYYIEHMRPEPSGYDAAGHNRKTSIYTVIVSPVDPVP
jgi:hypothetical protein